MNWGCAGPPRAGSYPGGKIASRGPTGTNESKPSDYKRNENNGCHQINRNDLVFLQDDVITKSPGGRSTQPVGDSCSCNEVVINKEQRWCTMKPGGITSMGTRSAHSNGHQ
jgi:hypothetical protein